MQSAGSEEVMDMDLDMDLATLWAMEETWEVAEVILTMGESLVEEEVMVVAAEVVMEEVMVKL
jgi:hypothetical protein